MGQVLRDFRYALRRLHQSPGFAAVAIITLALGIGANTAIFSFLNSFFLKPLPYPEPDQVVRVLERQPSGSVRAVSTLTFLDWQKQNTVFQFLAGQTSWSTTLSGVNEPLFLRGARISARYFDIAKVKPLLGRTFLPEEEQPGKDHVVVLGHPLWVNSFGADPNIINKTILLDQEPYTVVGVMPGGTIFDRTFAAVWKPLAFEPANMTRDVHWFGAFGRLKPGVTLQQARTEMGVIAARVAHDHSDTNKDWGVAVDRFGDLLLSDQMRSAIYILMAAAGMVLLSGCVNLANLALARGASRQREAAVRASLGASRGRLIRQLLTESMVLAILGGVCGVILGYATMKWLNAQIPPGELPAEFVVQMDGRVLLFALVISLVTGVMFGLAPALQAARIDLASSMKDGGRGASAGVAGKGLRNILVVVQVALAFVLLAGSGLLIRSFFGLLNLNPGFDSTNVLTMRLATPSAKYPDMDRLNSYLRELRTAVKAVPGVQETATTSALPLRGWGYSVPFAVTGSAAGAEVTDRSQRQTCFMKMVSPSYFHSVGIQLRQGNELTDRDVKGSPPVVVINETMAKRNFAHQNPIGQHLLIPEIKPGKNEFGPDLSWQIVGVIADEKIDALNDDRSPGVYASNEQVGFYSPNFVVRANVPPQLIERTVRRAIASVNPDQPVSDVATLDEIKATSLVETRLETTLLTVFGVIALLLAAVGIYGVISYSVAQRTNEMGIRAALGATAGNLRGLVLGNGLMLTAVGLVIGIIGALAVTQLMTSLLFGVGVRDPLTMAGVAFILALVALIACYFPARRATKVDPMTALRHE